MNRAARQKALDRKPAFGESAGVDLAVEGGDAILNYLGRRAKKTMMINKPAAALVSALFEEPDLNRDEVDNIEIRQMLDRYDPMGNDNDKIRPDVRDTVQSRLKALEDSIDEHPETPKFKSAKWPKR